MPSASPILGSHLRYMGRKMLRAATQNLMNLQMRKPYSRKRLSPFPK